MLHTIIVRKNTSPSLDKFSALNHSIVVDIGQLWSVQLSLAMSGIVQRELMIAHVCSCEQVLLVERRLPAGRALIINVGDH